MATGKSKSLRVGIAGLGAIGMEVAKRLQAGIPGLKLVAVSARDQKAARARLKAAKVKATVVDLKDLPAKADIVVECLPSSEFRTIAEATIKKRGIFMPLSVGALLENFDLVEKARKVGARIVAPTGALIGFDAVRAAAEGKINSVKMVTRKPPGGLEGAPYLVQKGISLKGLTEPLKVFDGSARDGAKGFPANVNVAAALSLAGIGPDRTTLQIWADPSVKRNTHRIEVDADSASFSMGIENIPSENPKTGRITALSVVSCLRGMVQTLRVGS